MDSQRSSAHHVVMVSSLRHRNRGLKRVSINLKEAKSWWMRRGGRVRRRANWQFRGKLCDYKGAIKRKFISRGAQLFFLTADSKAPGGKWEQNGLVKDKQTTPNAIKHLICVNHFLAIKESYSTLKAKQKQKKNIAGNNPLRPFIKEKRRGEDKKLKKRREKSYRIEWKRKEFNLTCFPIK